MLIVITLVQIKYEQWCNLSVPFSILSQIAPIKYNWLTHKGCQFKQCLYNYRPPTSTGFYDNLKI